MGKILDTVFAMKDRFVEEDGMNGTIIINSDPYISINSDTSKDCKTQADEIILTTQERIKNLHYQVNKLTLIKDNYGLILDSLKREKSSISIDLDQALYNHNFELFESLSERLKEVEARIEALEQKIQNFEAFRYKINASINKLDTDLAMIIADNTAVESIKNIIETAASIEELSSAEYQDITKEVSTSLVNIGIEADEKSSELDKRYKEALQDTNK